MVLFEDYHTQISAASQNTPKNTCHVLF